MPAFSLSRRSALALAIAGLATGARAAEVRERALGDPGAPVTIIEYASLTCPHCADFHEKTFPEVKARYVDAGKARFVFRDFPLDELALRAAQLAHCAGPGRYFRFLDVFFAQQSDWGRAADPISALKQLARLGGLGEAEADACLADEALADAILKVRLDGQQQFGVRSTPTLIVNGEVLSGGRGIDELAQRIDPLLN